jgi:hypothetical protein
MKLKALLVIAMLALVVGFLFRRPPDTALDAADATAIERAAAIGATPLESIREAAATVDPLASPNAGRNVTGQCGRSDGAGFVWCDARIWPSAAAARGGDVCGGAGVWAPR